MYDPDLDLRNEIVLDICFEYPKYISNATGILICGDIAFSGQSKEYHIAKEFIVDILTKLDLKETDVYCVPGNHDVDQSIPKKEPMVYQLQKMLEEQEDQNKFDKYIADVFHSEISRKALYFPIDCYNLEFAAQYSCDLTMDTPYWEKTFCLSDRIMLSLWGINSTIISNSDDHKEKDVKRKMRLSRNQIPRRKDNTIYMTLCHHPPECWNDIDNILINLINKRARIQLYGHKHLQTIETNENTIIVGSGATHPSRTEPEWIPRYNWITIDLINDNTECYLEVKIYPRIWSGDKFICDESNCTIEHGTKSNYFVDRLNVPNSILHTDTTSDKIQPITVDETIWKRKFVYSFINLPFVTRQSIIEKLGLFYPEEDEGKKHSEIIKDIISRAETKKCVQSLIEELNKNKEEI
jgi:predicted phosphodiesterase